MRCRIDTRHDSVTLEHRGVGVVEGISRPDIARLTSSIRRDTEVVRKFPSGCCFLDLLSSRDAFPGDNIIIDSKSEVATRGLTVHQPPRLDSSLLRISLSANRNAIVLAPLAGLLMWLRPQHIRIDSLQRIVLLKLNLNLPQERLGPRPGVAEDPNRYLWITQHLLDRESKRYDGALVMFTCPQIEPSIGIFLHLPATCK